MKYVTSLVHLAMWISGIILAKGFWLTAAAAVIPFVSWFIVIAHVIARLS